mgnify:CR=1 FL=1
MFYSFEVDILCVMIHNLIVLPSNRITCRRSRNNTDMITRVYKLFDNGCIFRITGINSGISCNRTLISQGVDHLELLQC